MVRCRKIRRQSVGGKLNLHCLFQALLVNWHLDSDMRKVLIDFGIRVGFDRRVVHRVFVILCNRTEAIPSCQSSGKKKGYKGVHEADISDQLKTEKLQTGQRMVA